MEGAGLMRGQSFVCSVLLLYDTMTATCIKFKKIVNFMEIVKRRIPRFSERGAFVSLLGMLYNTTTMVCTNFLKLIVLWK